MANVPLCLYGTDLFLHLHCSNIKLLSILLCCTKGGGQSLTGNFPLHYLLFISIYKQMLQIPELKKAKCRNISMSIQHETEMRLVWWQGGFRGSYCGSYFCTMSVHRYLSNSAHRSGCKCCKEPINIMQQLHIDVTVLMPCTHPSSSSKAAVGFGVSEHHKWQYIFD